MKIEELNKEKKRIKVLMLGESLSRQGGIVSVQKLILEQIDSTIQIKHIATLVNGSIWQKIVNFTKAILELSWRLLHEDIDLVHTHVSGRGSAFRQAITTLVALAFRKPVIMHAHGSEFHVFYSQLPKSLKWGLGWVFGKCERFIVLSENWKTFYTQNLKLEAERVIVLPNAVEIPPQIPTRPLKKDVSFVFFGRIGQRKGAFDLVRAFAALSSKYQLQAKLTLAGDGEGVKLRQLVKDLNVEDGVSVMDWIDSEQRNALSKAADVFVLPSYNEGLPMALLEAMSWGLASITTPVGGIPELVVDGENGLLVTPGNIEELSLAMQRLIEDSSLRIALGINGRKSVEPLNIQNYWNSLLELYCSVCDHSPSHHS
ncbi:MAG: glycosyltransferase family 4 protein [Oculatellaceae cyanobacterium bins.114]|nr:glycosyltransferase family 4 protein [Oculatellaceae cyanobacterium bins.114]